MIMHVAVDCRWMPMNGGGGGGGGGGGESMGLPLGDLGNSIID